MLVGRRKISRILAEMMNILSESDSMQREYSLSVFLRHMETFILGDAFHLLYDVSAYRCAARFLRLWMEDKRSGDAITLDVVDADFL